MRALPEQFLRIEINPRAVAIAEVVLWIGWLQWHLRDKKSPESFSEPILQAYGNIECRDALLEYYKKELVRDEPGKPVTRWDGVTTKKHPVTGEDVPDDTARVAVRVAMTVCSQKQCASELWAVTSESDGEDHAAHVEFVVTRGAIHSDLTAGTKLASAAELQSNQAICVQGIIPLGKGFIVAADEIQALLSGSPDPQLPIKQYRNGRDLTQSNRDAFVIDLDGLSEESVRDQYPAIYQHLLMTVKPERDQSCPRAFM